MDFLKDSVDPRLFKMIDLIFLIHPNIFKDI